MIFAVAAAFSADRMGHRLIFIVSCLGMLVSIALVSALSGVYATSGIKATGTAVLPFSFIFSGLFYIAFTLSLYTYIYEIWPSNLRTRGLSKGLLFTQLAIFFNLFVDPVFLKSIKWRYRFLQMGLLFYHSLCGLYFLPRDKGHSLEEMTMMFEGSNNAVMVDSSVVYSIVRSNTTRINDHE